MNTFTKAIAITTLTFSSIGLATASNVVPTDNYITTKLCVTATQGSKLKLAKAIKHSGLDRSFVAKTVKCNDISIVNFVEQHGSNVEQVNNYLTNGKYSNNLEVTNLAAR